MSQHTDAVNGSSWSDWLSSVVNFQTDPTDPADNSPSSNSAHNPNHQTSPNPSSPPSQPTDKPDSNLESNPDPDASRELNEAPHPDPDSSPYADVDPLELKHLWNQLYSVSGMDLVKMRLSLPIWLFEPTTSLTRMAETFQFSDLLDRAANLTDPVHRDSLVASFVVSAFAHTERVRKPFNPVLGETFEFINPVNDMKFYAEQVSHHPPISVSRAEGNGWVAGEIVNVHATFQGNSVEVINSGTRYIHLTETGDKYTWNLPKALISNLFVGGTFVDHHGHFDIQNHTTKTVAKMYFAKCGWFSASRYDVSGELLDPKGEKLVEFKGAWNRFLDSSPIVKEITTNTTAKAQAKVEGINRLWMAGPHLLTDEEGGGATGVLAHCTKFTKRTLACDVDYATELPPTDSRLRPDRIALEQADSVAAAEQKLCIEELQRDRHAAMEEAEKNGEKPPCAHYFRKLEGGENMWEPTGTYWTDSRSYMDEDEKRAEACLW